MGSLLSSMLEEMLLARESTRTSPERSKATIPFLQAVSRDLRIQEGTLTPKKASFYYRPPSPPDWRIRYRPQWHELPYFTHLKYSLVTSDNLMKSRRWKDPELLEALKSLEELPEGCEVLLNNNKFLYVDHTQRLASEKMSDLSDTGLATPPSEKGSGGWGSGVPTLSAAAGDEPKLVDQSHLYWSYVAQHPHYYVEHPEEAEDATREACLAITSQLLHEVLPANRDYNLSGSAAHDHDTQERTEFESEIKLLRWYEGKHNANCGRRIIRVAAFLAEYAQSRRGASLSAA